MLIGIEKANANNNLKFFIYFAFLYNNHDIGADLHHTSHGSPQATHIYGEICALSGQSQ